MAVTGHFQGYVASADKCGLKSFWEEFPCKEIDQAFMPRKH
jgi:hypothetical protein